MNISQVVIDDTVVLRLTGKLDGSAVETLSNQVKEAIWSRHSAILINLQGVEFVDSTGLGLLVFLFRQAKEQNTDFAICGLSAQALMVFEITRMTRIFVVHPNESAALSVSA
ncbi:STAS domain-containing protein [Alteromonas lipolytica]|uniref:Anti-sigma factor antagonist n=1 Tax=Alteromonas lipolytica TaxID=1856405 RepID=A0A1E8FB95_9ALTE|nr:STAS domain-containing protein [Alteromonas lipolytica]OFI33056.1 hypothetical protein BFC17_01945 [Alteromonas lipolytica]GGF62916.1 anti-sigma factor antagonist [Alteromonas lipolytica]